MAEVDAKQARLLLKQKQADWRKTAKQLKAKDQPTKIAAIEKCKAENYEPILAGDCLGQLMQLLVAKKKNAPIVTAASQAILTFVKDGPQADVDASAEPPLVPYMHALKVIEQGTKKKPKVPGGALFTNLAAHDDLTIAKTAMQTLHLLTTAALAHEAATAEAVAAAEEAGTKVDEKAQAAAAMRREQLMRG